MKIRIKNHDLVDRRLRGLTGEVVDTTLTPYSVQGPGMEKRIFRQLEGYTIKLDRTEQWKSAKAPTEVVLPYRLVEEL